MEIFGNAVAGYEEHNKICIRGIFPGLALRHWFASACMSRMGYAISAKTQNVDSIVADVFDYLWSVDNRLGLIPLCEFAGGSCASRHICTYRKRRNIYTVAPN